MINFLPNIAIENMKNIDNMSNRILKKCLEFKVNQFFGKCLCMGNPGGATVAHWFPVLKVVGSNPIQDDF